MSLEVLIVLGIAIIVGVALSRRFNLIEPVVLILIGLAAAFIPHLGHVGLPHHVVLAIFLPILLYWEALTVSLNQMKRAMRGIILSGTVLVVITAAVIALAGVVAGLSTGAALLIGACLGPTDATAVSALGGNISSQHKTILQAESLINDGTALVIFSVALQIAGGGSQLTAWGVSAQFLISFIGGSAVGAVMAGLVVKVFTQMKIFQEDALLANLARLIVPFASFFIAEQFDASGVLAVVICGILVSRFGTSSITLGSRYVAFPLWTMMTFILNAALFLLVGFEIPHIVGALSRENLIRGLILVPIIYIAMVAARFVGHHAIIFSIRVLDRRPEQKQRRTNFRSRIVSVVAGFRGAISLAMALSIPDMFGDSVYGERDLIVFVVAGVVFTSLIVQGVLLPYTITWANARPAPAASALPIQRDERTRALEKSMTLILENLDSLAAQQDVTSSEVIESVRAEYQAKLKELQHADSDEHPIMTIVQTEEGRLRAAALEMAHREITRQRDAGELSDEHWKTLTTRIDIELLRVSEPVIEAE